MRIASYNIRKAVGLDWKRKPTRILDVLEEIQADIVILQEADKRFGIRSGTLPIDDLFRRLDYQFVNAAIRVHSHGWHGNAILYRSPLTVRDLEFIPLPALEPRGAISVIFETEDNKTLCVIGTHLALLGPIRRKQATKISDHIALHKGQIPTIVAGDFNEWRLKGPSHQVFSVDHRVITPGASFHSAKPIVPLDRFVLTKELAFKTCSVHHSTTAAIASDHLPIYLDFEI